MQHEEQRRLVQWHKEYMPGWDTLPEEYLMHDVVQWGRSRRLGLLRLGVVKAYIGVQHVDPDKPGWSVVEEPRARFFLSLFVSGRCVTLRTFPTMAAVFDALGSFLGGTRE